MKCVRFLLLLLVSTATCLPKLESNGARLVLGNEDIEVHLARPGELLTAVSSFSSFSVSFVYFFLLLQMEL